MSIEICPVIQAAELLKLYKSSDLVIFDATDGENAKSNYDEKHLEGAIYVNLSTQLAEIKNDVAIGGRHPLPKIENFAETLSKLGISSKSQVVIYDDKNGANAAARFWWMLKSIGHEKVQVLNGGFQEAVKINFPTSSTTESNAPVLTPGQSPGPRFNSGPGFSPGPGFNSGPGFHPRGTGIYQTDHWILHIADINEVEKVSQDKKHIVIDVRSFERYNGETEPIDLIAGHIPGAINIPFTENLDKNGLFLSPNELKEKYTKIFGNVKSENIIVHCGSGVTACHTLLAIAYANLEIPKLYVGSWSEWSRNKKVI